MKTSRVKNSVTILFMALCLLSMDPCFAQRLPGRLPHKALKIELMDKTAKQLPVKPEAGIYSSAGPDLSKSKVVDGTGPCLLNGINLANSVRNYIGASVFNKPARISGLFKRKYSPSFK